MLGLQASDLHAEGDADPGDPGTEPSEADEAEAAPVEIDADMLLPARAAAEVGDLAGMLRISDRISAQVKFAPSSPARHRCRRR